MKEKETRRMKGVEIVLGRPGLGIVPVQTVIFSPQTCEHTLLAYAAHFEIMIIILPPISLPVCSYPFPFSP